MQNMIKQRQKPMEVLFFVQATASFDRTNEMKPNFQKVALRVAEVSMTRDEWNHTLRFLHLP